MTLETIARTLTDGGVVAMVTDTVYGLACDPASADAVDRIYAIKRRPADLELTMLTASIDDIEEDVDLTPAARMLAAAFWPGALSIVSGLHRRRLAIPRSGDTLSVRVPDHALALALLRMTGPLATTSANRHGDPPATTADAVASTLDGEVDGILDGGPSGGLASTIIDCTSTTPRVLREGPIPAAVLLSLLAGFPPTSTEGQRSL
jgi:L-threonylcarbamoyladenylate synthase